MNIVHISDTHGYHAKINIPNCDVLIHTGDIGGRTDLRELESFLKWFEAQPATRKIFCAGNHDLILDKKEANKEKDNPVKQLLTIQNNTLALNLISQYKVIYLNNTSYTYEDVKFYGSPYSPSFHRKYWAFNADSGVEIQKEWGKIPSDVNVLLTHTPCYGILDRVDDKYREEVGEDMNVGCKDLLAVVKKRLVKLKLHASGHIHDNFGVLLKPISQSRNCLFSNGAVLDNTYKVLQPNPVIITI